MADFESADLIVIGENINTTRRIRTNSKNIVHRDGKVFWRYPGLGGQAGYLDVTSQYPEDEAKISVFDRGFLFADGVYEVTSVLAGKLIDNDAHMARLQRSLDELQMSAPISLEETMRSLRLTAPMP